MSEISYAGKSFGRVLLTGGTGYIGSHTALVLADAGLDVVLYDNLSNSKHSVSQRINSIAKREIPFVIGDVRDGEMLDKTLKEYAIDAVVHFAGFKAVGESVEKPIDYFENNLGGAISLLKAMSNTGIKTLVFSSSATVYGEPQYLPLDEAHPTRAINPYGRSKLQIEEILADVAVSDSDWHIACLRYFNPVGAHDSGLIGEDPEGAPENLMPYIAQVASGLRPHLNIYGDDYDTGDGTGVRDYIHVVDLAEGHRSALDFLGRNPGWHAINLGTGRGYSVLEMVEAFEHASGKRIPRRVAARRAGDVASCYAKAEKAYRELHWQANRTLDEMCQSAWRFQAKSMNLETQSDIVGGH